MRTVDNLPGDQRAVLQLVLGRRRTYEQIAGMLSMNPGSVRERALAAVDALGPDTDLSPENQVLITDYLLGQLSDPAQIARARQALAGSPAERAWARVVASELSQLAGGPLPEIPTGSDAPTGSGAGPGQSGPTGEASPTPAGEPPVAGTPGPPAAASPAAEPEPVESPVAAAAGPAIVPADAGSDGGQEPPEGGRRGSGSAGGRRSSRVGGAVVIAAVLAAIVVAVVLLVPGANNSGQNAAAVTSSTTSTGTGTGTGSASSSSSSTTSSSTSTTNTSASAKVVAQINLTPPGGGSKAAGIAEVLDEGSSQGIAIVAQNIPPNKTGSHPNAYAVWLYNSPSDAKILGFVNPGVGSNGRLSTAGSLPGNASHYKKLIVTVETQAKPAKPGRIILQGALTGLS